MAVGIATLLLIVLLVGTLLSAVLIATTVAARRRQRVERMPSTWLEQRVVEDVSLSGQRSASLR